tara:strand:+ start:103 stop:573 length:471 start_codon:yes stop_codon:yes gene_type:complete
MNTIFENWRVDLLFEEWWTTPLTEEAADPAAKARARQMRSWSPQKAAKLLGVAVDASEKEIKTAARKLFRTHHPDLNPGSTVDLGNVHLAAKFLSDRVKKGGFQQASAASAASAAGAPATAAAASGKSPLYGSVMKAFATAFAPPQSAVAEGRRGK